MSPVTTLQQAARVQGSFRLTLGDDVTRPLAYDISAPKLQIALEEDLGNLSGCVRADLSAMLT
jgi:hypothetical protein